MRLLLATSNGGKVKEFRRLSGETGLEILCLKDLARLWRAEGPGNFALFREPGDPAEARTEAPAETRTEIRREVQPGEQTEAVIRLRYQQLAEKMAETGSTFEENAIRKATGAAAYTGLLTLADDSGLETDYLDGAPGVYSARYAGPEGDAAACNELLLRNMAAAPAERRGARFKAVLALASPQGLLCVTEGVCEGRIGFAPKGGGGFGYDPLFITEAGGRTMAELTTEEKNRISHRGKALAKMLVLIKNQT